MAEPEDFSAYIKTLEGRIKALEENSSAPPKMGVQYMQNPSQQVTLGWKPSRVFVYDPLSVPNVTIDRQGFTISVPPDFKRSSQILWMAWQ